MRASFAASLEEDAFNELWNNRSDLDLHIPLLSGNPGMYGHVLHCELNFDGQTPQLDHLAQAEPDWDRPDVLRRRGPVRQDITRVPDAPTIAEEDRRNRLQVHLVGIGPAMLAADGPPLLGKDAQNEILRQVPYQESESASDNPFPINELPHIEVRFNRVPLRLEQWVASLAVL